VPFYPELIFDEVDIFTNFRSTFVFLLIFPISYLWILWIKYKLETQKLSQSGNLNTWFAVLVKISGKKITQS